MSPATGRPRSKVNASRLWSAAAVSAASSWPGSLGKTVIRVWGLFLCRIGIPLEIKDYGTERAVTGSDGNWHETLHSEGPPPSSSDRSFGLLFAAVCGAIALFGVWEERRSALWWVIAASVFFVVSLFAAPLLGPLNRAWRWLSLQLFRVFNPVIMAVVFFGVLTPIAIIMRQVGRDPLEPKKPSYWLARTSVDGHQTSMTDQF